MGARTDQPIGPPTVRHVANAPPLAASAATSAPSTNPGPATMGSGAPNAAAPGARVTATKPSSPSPASASTTAAPCGPAAASASTASLAGADPVCHGPTLVPAIGAVRTTYAPASRPVQATSPGAR